MAKLLWNSSTKNNSSVIYSPPCHFKRAVMLLFLLLLFFNIYFWSKKVNMSQNACSHIQTSSVLYDGVSFI